MRMFKVKPFLLALFLGLLSIGEHAQSGNAPMVPNEPPQILYSLPGTWTAVQTFNPPGVSQPIVTINNTGNIANNSSANLIGTEIFYVDDSFYPNATQRQTYPFFVEYRKNVGNFSNVNGGFNAIGTHGLLANPTSSTNTNRNYTGGSFTVEIANGDGGFGTTASGTNASGQPVINVASAGSVNTTDQPFILDDAGVWEKCNVVSVVGNAITCTSNLINSASTNNTVNIYRGGAFSFGAITQLDAGATFMRDAGIELNNLSATGASVAGKHILSLTQSANDVVPGTIWDSILEISNNVGATNAAVAIEFSDEKGKLPIGTSGCLLCIVSKLGSLYTIGTGIDFGSFTNVTGNILNFNNGSITGAGVFNGTAFNSPKFENLSSTQILIDFANNAGNTNQILMCRNTTATRCDIDIETPNTSTPAILLRGDGRAFSLTGQIGSVTSAAVMSSGELAFTKLASADNTAPGAGFLKLEVQAGTTGGTCKLVGYAGTSTTATTIIDNVGSGC